MGLLDRILGRPESPGVPETVGGLPALSGRAIRFAAQRIEPGVMPPSRKTLAKTQKRQAEMWNAYEAIGEIGYVVDFFANAMRRVRVFPAGIDDPEEGRIPLDECSWASPQLAADARALLDRVRSVEHGQGEILAQMAANLKVAGAGNLYADIDPVTGEEDWEVLSTEALTVHRGRWVIRRYPDEKDPEPARTDALWRFWQRHPRWPGMAYSEMSRVLGHAENLQLLERAFRGRARSRIAGAGLLVMSNKYTLNGWRNPANPGGSGSDVFDDLMVAGTTAIEDEGAASAFMPIIADFDVDDARKVAHHITFDRPLTAEEEAREDKLLRRIAQGLDAPAELVTGMADLNHWTAWQVQDSTYEAHVEPLALRIADILAVTVLRSGLLTLGYPSELVARVTVGVDPAELIRRPNRAEDAKQAHDRLVISDEALRRELGYTDDDAPDNAELLRRMALKRGITTEQLTAELLANYADADVARTLAKGDATTEQRRIQTQPGGEGTAPASRPAPGEPGPPEPSEPSEPDEPAEVTAAAVVTAAASALGARLHSIDAHLAARLTGAAEAAVERALERATSRAANRARRTEYAAACRAGGRGLAARLGTVGMAALGLDDETLVTDADFDVLAGQWATWVPEAWDAAVAELDQTAPRSVTVEPPEDDFNEAWLLLLALLVRATRQALHDTSDPVGTSGPGEPPPGTPAAAPGVVAGETDPAAIVQPGMIREAMSRAGGAHGQATTGGAVLVDAGTRPAGGVATGEQILAEATRVGLVLSGWTWRVGAPSVPFPPHQALAGVTFDRWDSPALANPTGAWPGGSHWRPGDHRGCRCTAEPILEPVTPN